VRKVLTLAALAVGAFIVVPAASASTLSTTLTKLPGKVRLNSSFTIAAPQCVPDWDGWYPYACEEADLVFRVQRKHPTGWRNVYADSDFVYTTGDALKGTDIERLYISFFRGWGSGIYRNRLHRVRVTLVDNFASTPNPTRTRYFWAKYRAPR
jgi:hypothetical protein